MSMTKEPKHGRRGFASVVAMTALLAGCPQSVTGADAQRIDASDACDGEVCTRAGAEVDLLVEIDNSNTMSSRGARFLTQLPALLATLTESPCVSASNPQPHACSGEAGEQRRNAPVRSLRVGVISTDLGTPGSNVPVCAISDVGDDGLLNPIRFGQAMARHEPWSGAPPGYPRPTDCTDPNQFPSFITFSSDATDPTQFTHDFQCNAAIVGGLSYGCGLESQLEAIYRALIIHDARDVAGNSSPNAGFLRENAFLAIMLLSDEEDGSVRDCRYANGEPCVDATDVYDPASTAWASPDLNSRFYAAQPCSPQDPTWRLERYVDPRDANHGLLALKPGHPERIVFTAITGVPLAIPTRGEFIEWDGLLGVPGPDRENFCQRDSSGLAHITSAEGPTSMAQGVTAPNCPGAFGPSCREEGSAFDPTACTTDRQYFAWPARRIVEIARRFDESPLCNGGPCRNGAVTSICGSNYASALAPLVARLAR